MAQEQEFWARVLELAHTQLKKTTFDFFVAEAKLIKIENNQATIHLDSQKAFLGAKFSRYYPNGWFRNLQ